MVKNWKERNKKWLGRPRRTGVRDDTRRQRTRCWEERRAPRAGRPTRSAQTNSCAESDDPVTIATAYCEDIGITLEEMDDQPDWEFFADCARVEAAADWSGMMA